MARRLWAVLALSCAAAADDVAAIAARLDSDRAREAAEQLAELGPRAKEAIPQLLAALAREDPELKWRAAWALSRMGKEAAPAAPALVLAQRKSEGLPAVAAHVALQRIGRAGAEAVLAAMRQAPVEERKTYLDLLDSMDPKLADAAEALIPLLPEEGLRWQICAMLEELRGDAASAAPALVGLLRDGNIHSDECDALLAIGEASVAPLRELALDEKAVPDARATAIALLIRIGGPGIAAAKEGLEESDDEVWGMSFCVLRIVVKTGGVETQEMRSRQDAAVLVPLLEKRAMADFVPSDIIDALLAFGPAGEAAVERALFTRQPEDSDDAEDPDDRRVDLVHQLYLRPRTDKVLPWLFHLAEPSEPERVRDAALFKLSRIPLEGDAAQRVAALAERTLAGNTLVACDLAGNAGPAASGLADKLRPLLADRSPGVRAAAASALCRIGKGGEGETRVLAKVVEGAKAGVEGSLRYDDAIKYIALAGPAASACWESLVAALESRNPFVRLSATEGLVRMLPALGANRRPAIAALKGAAARVGYSRVFDEIRDVPTLIDMLSGPWSSGRSLEDRIVESGESAWEPLVACLDSPDLYLRVRAATMLLRIDFGRADERVWAVALREPHLGFIEACQEHGNAAVTRLMNSLSSEDADTRRTALCVLGELAAAAAAARIRDVALQDPDMDVRATALWALDAVLPPPP